MPSGIDNNGNYYYVRSGITLSNTHGSLENRDIHLREFEDVCNLIIDKKLNQFTKDLNTYIDNLANEKIERVIEGYLKGTQYDVDVIAQIALDTGNEIFKGEQVKRYISDTIFKEIKKQLEGKTFKI